MTTYKSPGGFRMSHEEAVSYLTTTTGLATVNLSMPGWTRPVVQVETRPGTKRIALSQIGSVAGVTINVAVVNAALWTAAAELANAVCARLASDRSEQDQEN